MLKESKKRTNQKVIQITFRITKGQFKILEKAAKTMNTTPNDAARMLVIDSIITKPEPEVDPDHES